MREGDYERALHSSGTCHILMVRVGVTRDLFWKPFWDQIGPRGAKMGPRGPPRASKYRKPAFTKTVKNHEFSKVFGGPRPSKTASEVPRRLPRGYLGLLGAISNHLGAILETRAF